MQPEQPPEVDLSTVPELPGRGMPVPAALFAPWRRAPFTVFDELGDPAAIDSHWIEDCEGETVYVARGDLGQLRDYLERYLHDILHAEAVPLADRAWAVHRALIHELAFLFGRGSERTRSNTLTTICRELAVFMVEHGEHVGLFSGMRGAVQHTPVVHAVETVIGTLSLAVTDGQTTRDSLAVLAAGAAFADVGLLDLPQRLREPDTALPPLEWLERKAYARHPEQSQQRMRDLGIVARVAQLAVRSHHERWDGRGQPDGLAGEQIPIEARYVAIADSYASLTTVRHARPRPSRREALQQMAADGGRFDPRLLRLLVQLLSASPPPAVAVPGLAYAG